MELIVIIGAVVFFLFIFLGTKNGWKELAKVYSGPNLIKEHEAGWVKTRRSGKVNLVIWMGKSRNNLRIRMGATSVGLILKPFSLLTILRPPLFIPWSDVSASWYERSALGITSRLLRLDIKMIPDVKLGLRDIDAKELKIHSKGGWKTGII